MKPDEIPLLHNEATRRILAAHADADPDEFALANAGRHDIAVRALAEQIACRRKAATKLPFLAGSDFLYDAVALQQCSSEATARYRASLLTGTRLIDLTGGLGIDTSFLSRCFDEVHYCEQSPTLLALFEINRSVLGIEHPVVHPGDSIETLTRFPEGSFDWAYVDPARRDAHGRHVVLQRCVPNIVESFSVLRTRAHHICIKASPLLEPAALVSSLPGIESARFVSYGGECRELVLLVDAAGSHQPMRRMAVVLDNQGQVIYEIDDTEPGGACATATRIDRFIFEPDPAIARAHLWGETGARFGLHTVNRTTALLTGASCIDTFPGRVFAVESVQEWHRGTLRGYLRSRGLERARVSCRDFPMRPERLREMLGVGEGGATMLLFTRTAKGAKVCIHCTRATDIHRRPQGGAHESGSAAQPG